MIAKGVGYRNLDRDITKYDKFKLEITDLYKDETLYFVKIGTPQKLNYVIDQSLAAVKYLQDNRRCIEIDSKSIVPKCICIWLILDRKSDVNNLADFKSLIFLMKINEWRRQVINARYIPKVVLSYKE